MKQFNSIEDMEQYLNGDTRTYNFFENGERLDIEITFDLNIWANIIANDIHAKNIVAGDMDARDIKAGNITAGDISALDITAQDINFYAVCYAYKSIVCKSIRGGRKNSKYFTLDGEVIIKE